MLALRLPPELEARLDAVARRTGRTKSFCAREAIIEHIEDREDYYHAADRVGTAGSERISLDDLMAEFADDLQANPAHRRAGPAGARGPASAGKR